MSARFSLWIYNICYICMYNVYPLLSSELWTWQSFMHSKYIFVFIKHSRVDFVKKSETAKEKKIFSSFLILLPFRALLNLFISSKLVCDYFLIIIYLNEWDLDGFLYRFRSDRTCMLCAFHCFFAFHFITQCFFL